MRSSTVDFSKLQVLLVENNRLTRRILRELLRGFGTGNVQEVDNVPDAFAFAYRDDFDIIILDFFLGDMDGADFTWRLRQDPACRNRKVPILLITADPDHQKVLKVRDAGVDGMLAKPIAAGDLHARITAMLARPRPFIVSPTYVGPDRNAKARRAELRRGGGTAARGDEPQRLSLFADPDADTLLLTKTVSSGRKARPS